MKRTVCSFRDIQFPSSRREEGGVMGEINNFNNTPEIHTYRLQEASHGNPPQLAVQSGSCLK